MPRQPKVKYLEQLWEQMYIPAIRMMVCEGHVKNWEEGIAEALQAMARSIAEYEKVDPLLTYIEVQRAYDSGWQTPVDRMP